MKLIYSFWRRSIAIALMVVVIFSLVACAPKAPCNQLVLSVLSDPKTFNAVLSQESPNIFGLTYRGLITENPLTGKKEGDLAESWEVSPDKKRFVFTLREGLKWSDGKPLTAEDVVFSYNELYLNTKIPSNDRDSLKIGKSQEFPKITKLDDRRIEFILPEPYAPFLDAAGLAILPAHILRETVKKTDKDGNPIFISTWGLDTPPEEIVVNGPYKLKEYRTSERVIFERNPYFWKKDKEGNPLPYIEQIVWAIVESQETFLTQFRSGGLDSISISPEQFSLLKKEEKAGNFTIYNGGPAYGTSFLSFNLNQGKKEGKPLVDPIKSRWFNNINFRRAVAYAIDRQRMVNNIFRGLGQQQNSSISFQSPYYDSSLKGYEYNPEKAKELLRKEGFKYNEQGELFDGEGNRVRFTLITNAGNKTREAIGSQIKQDLAKIGIQVDYSPIAFNVLVDKLSNTLDWEAHILGFTGGNEPHSPNIWYPDGNLHTFNQKPQPGTEAITGWKVSDWEKKIGDLYVEGARELDLDKRKKIYAEVQQLEQEYLPFIYLVNPYSLSAVRNRVKGIQYSALGGPFWNIEELKLDCK